MRKISLNETSQIHHSENCKSTEYDFGEKDIDISMLSVNGKFPENGFLKNTKVKELALVIEGFGSLCKKDQTINFEAGDAILIDVNEEYFWDGNCKVVLTCSPAWSKEQHKIVK